MIWLSHELNKETPAYGGGEGVVITPENQLCKGHSCNSVKLSLSNHLGTHVDVPYHFLEKGKKLSDYSPTDWVFDQPGLAELPVGDDAVITPEMLEEIVFNVDESALDLLLIKTDFEKIRTKRNFWENSPGFSPELPPYLKNRFPSI